MGLSNAQIKAFNAGPVNRAATQATISALKSVKNMENGYSVDEMR